MRVRKPLVLFLSLCAYCLQHFYATANNLDSTSFDFANFKAIHFNALLVKTLDAFSVENVVDCTFLCFKHPGKCVSFNIQAEPTRGLLHCELLAGDIFHSPDKFQGNGTFHHYAMQTQCTLKNPCRNGGTCLPDYASKSYQCNCTQLYSGRDCEVPPPSDCMDYHKAGHNTNGVYSVNPRGMGTFDVFCDQTTEGGGWTVFQKRLDGSVDFYRNWADYKQGFGDLNGELWLGLDKIHRLTSQTGNKLRVELEDFDGNTAYAEYDTFAVLTEPSKYQLSLGAYTGTAGDSLSYHNGKSFSTKDQDNDRNGKNCAVQFKGAWWFGNTAGCLSSDLNGFYHHGAHDSYADGVNWRHWKGYHYSAKRAEMKTRPVSP